jgi:AcrR family transcriptional regulator
MAGDRRIGLETSASRTALIDSVETIMREEGYAALSARRVAEHAGLKHQLVYYYFQSMDELAIAAYQRHANRMSERIEGALASPQPLHTLWRVLSEPSDARLNVEFIAMASHNEAIRNYTLIVSAEMRRKGRRWAQDNSDPTTAKVISWLEARDPAILAMAIGAIGTILGLESTLGITDGHAEMRSAVEWCLDRLETPAGEADRSDCSET